MTGFYAYDNPSSMMGFYSINEILLVNEILEKYLGHKTSKEDYDKYVSRRKINDLSYDLFYERTKLGTISFIAPYWNDKTYSYEGRIDFTPNKNIAWPIE